MSNPSTSVRDDDVRDTEGLNPLETESSFGDILNQFEQSHTHEAPGEKGVEATVVAVREDKVFFDVGQKIEGVMDASLLRDDKGLIELKPGDTVQVGINGRNEEGYIQLSLIRVERPKDWSGLQKAFDEKLTISGTVTSVIKGGLAVDIGMRAFMPASRSGARDVPEMQTLVGQEISCRIIKLDTDKEDIVVDRRVVLEEERAKAKESRFHELHVGDVTRGTVRSLLDYGAFIDIGGVDGMLHVADISHGRVNKPADVLTVGQELDVKILKVDAGKKRISLGLKQLQPDPWTTAADKYHVGDRVQGLHDCPVTIGEQRVAERIGAVEPLVVGPARFAGSGIAGQTAGTRCARFHGLAVVFAGQQAIGKRAPWHHAQARITRQRQVLLFHFAADQRIEILKRDRPRQPVRASQSHQFCNIPGRRVRHTPIADLACTDECGHRFQQLLGRCHRIPDVDPVKIHIIGAKAPQRSLQCGPDMLGAIAAPVRPIASRKTRFGGQHNHIAQTSLGDKTAQHLLTAAAGIHIRGIYKIPASLDISIENILRARFVGAPPRGAERHRAQSERADGEARAAECAIMRESHINFFHNV